MPNDLRSQITEIMLKLGMQPKHSGFMYLREAIFLYFEKPNGEDKISTELYPKIAKMFGVSVTIVERNIRVLINDSQKNGGLYELNAFFGSVVFNNSFVLSNGEVVAMIVEILKLNQIKYKLVQENS